eukprot:GHVU01017598.1.p1 GENE.GHVU01017598.1~~GHVU01017598.1.p1  ORF type:complete len:181 (+),score=27.33 GHVU01017598.1:246-788(+)
MSERAENVGIKWSDSCNGRQFQVTLADADNHRHKYFRFAGKDKPYSDRTAALAAMNEFHENGNWFEWLSGDTEEPVGGEDTCRYQSGKPWEQVVAGASWLIEKIEKVEEVRGHMAAYTRYEPTWEWVAGHVKDCPEVVQDWLETERKELARMAGARGVALRRVNYDKVEKLFEQNRDTTE